MCDRPEAQLSEYEGDFEDIVFLNFLRWLIKDHPVWWLVVSAGCRPYWRQRSEVTCRTEPLSWHGFSGTSAEWAESSSCKDRNIFSSFSSVWTQSITGKKNHNKLMTARAFFGFLWPWRVGHLIHMHTRDGSEENINGEWKTILMGEHFYSTCTTVVTQAWDCDVHIQ